MSSFLNRDMLLARPERKVQRVECQELGGHVFIRELYGNEIEDLVEASTKKGAAAKNASARVLVACLSDENGNQVLKPSDSETLSRSLKACVLLRLVKAATKFNGLDEDDEAELLGNSETTATSDSGTD